MCSSNPIHQAINRAIVALYGTYFTGTDFYIVPDKTEREVLTELKSTLISEGLQGIGIPTILAYAYVEQGPDGGTLIKIK